MIVIKQILKPLVSLIIIAGVFSYLGFKLFEEWETVSKIYPWEHPGLVVLHFLLLALMSFFFVTGWFFSLGINNVSLRFNESAFIWLVPNLGKYIPGKIFMVAGRIAFSKWFNVRKSECLCAMTVEHLYMLIATSPFIFYFIDQNFLGDYSVSFLLYAIVLFGGFLFIFWPGLFFKFFNKILELVRRSPITARLSIKRNLLMLLNYLVAWSFYGLSGVVLAIILNIDAELPVFYLMSTFVVSWMLGFMSMLTPGGVGVREAIIVLLLSTKITTAEAIALAIIARITWTLVEMSGVLVGLYIKNKHLNAKLI